MIKAGKIKKEQKKMAKNIFFAAALMVVITYIITTPVASAVEKIPILLYHNIKEVIQADEDLLLNITPRNFSLHLETLKKNGYNTISFNEYYEYIEKSKPLPSKPIIISFDDGYISNYFYAYPMLKRSGMKATIFVVTSRMGAKVNDGVVYEHFSWKEAIEMQDSGIIDIESHSDTHRDMSNSSISDMQFEMRRSKYLIEKNMDKECNIFAFPYGGNTLEAHNLGKNAGYKVLCLLGDAKASNYKNGIVTLQRITISGDWTGAQLLKAIGEN
ncbi:MAG: polysaccharide deacetylase family protein [Clostridiales bacterium]|nr:polysaccharide deacetylase family protein [Clostridiales bacterium]